MLFNNWSEGFFDDDFARIFLTWDDATRDETAAFLIDALDLAPGQLVFDQHCGIGRVSLALAAHGIRCVGVDLAANYIATAIRLAEADDLPCRFVHGDGHEFVPDEPCDAVVNWFTSIGYGDDDDRNIKVLQRAFEALRPGGRLALDYNNVPRTLRGFAPQTESVHDGPDGDIVVNHYVALDFELGMFRMHWTFRYPDGRKVAQHGCGRMYLPWDLVRMARDCGFEVEQLLGGVDGAAYELDSPRAILIARKP